MGKHFIVLEEEVIMKFLIVMFLCIFCASCGGNDGESGCHQQQVEVTYLGTSNDRTECMAIPDVCNNSASCSDQPCIAAMYALCQAPAFGVGCSDTFPPTIISCNE
jgi:hypothetical protein